MGKHEIELDSHNQPTSQTTTTTTTKAIKELFGKINIMTTHLSNMAWMNLYIKEKHSHRHLEQTCGCQGGCGEGVEYLGSLGLGNANYYI